MSNDFRAPDLQRKVLAAFFVFSVLYLTSCELREPQVQQIQHDADGDLVKLGFDAIKSGDTFLVEPLLMNQTRYRRLCEGTDEPVNDGVIAGLEADAKDLLVQSLRQTRKLLDDLHFDLDVAQLKAVVVTAPRREGDLGTRWIEFKADDARVRLDISYLIESDGNLAEIKLNDVFLVDGARYLARGFRFQAYRPNDDADESVHALVVANHLDGMMPQITMEHE